MSLIKPRQKQPIVLNATTNRPITTLPPTPSYLQTHVTTLQNNTVRLVTNSTVLGANQASITKLRLKPGQKLDWLFKAKAGCMAAQRDIQKKVFEMTTRQSKIDTIDDLASMHNDFQTFLSKLTSDINQIGNTMKMEFISGLQSVTLINRPPGAAGGSAASASGTARKPAASRPLGGLKIRPTSELMARSAPPPVVDSGPVEIDDDDDCTVVEDLPDPISLEPEVCLSEPEGDGDGPEALMSMLVPEVNLVVGDEAVKGDGDDAAVDKGTEKKADKGEEQKGQKEHKEQEEQKEQGDKEERVEGRGQSNADKGEENTETEPQLSQEKAPDLDAAAAAEKASAHESESGSDDDVDDDDDGDPETKIMIRRAMQESALENITLENRNVPHNLGSDKRFDHYLSVRVYMESDYGTGLPVRTDLPVKIKEEPVFDIEEMLKGTMVSRSNDRTSFGDAFSQFLNTSDAVNSAGEGGDAKGAESNGEAESGDDEGNAAPSREDVPANEHVPFIEAPPGAQVGGGAPPQIDESPMELDSILNGGVPNGMCTMKSTCENHDSGIGVDHNDLRILENETKHLSDVPLDELLFEIEKSPSAIDFIGFDDKLLN